MRVLSLFDGISCARVALERAGFKVEKYYASEVDKYAIQIAQKNYPDTIQLGDVRSITKEMVGGVDLIIGGSPCQDLSIAKKNRKGLDGERSGLFWEYVRILKEVNPRYFVLENVASMPKEAKELITKALGVEPIMIDAALVSAQRRRRLFWTNIPNVTQPEDRGILLKDILQDNVNESYSIYNKKLSIRKATTLGSNPQCLTAKTGQCIPIRVGQINKGSQGDRIYSPAGKSVGLSAFGGGKGGKTGLYAIPEKSKTIRTGGRSSGLNDKHNWDTHQIGDRVRRLTPIECERLQCLDDNWTDGISNTQRYKCLGNAFNVDVVAHILGFIYS